MAFANFETVARAALAQAQTLVPAWLPEGKQHGSEYVTRNPTRQDATAGSFSINLESGAWSDFAEGGNAKGGDLISLYAYLHGLPQGKACAALARDLGVAPPPAAKTDNSKHVSPVPDSAPEPPAKHPRHGKPSAQWIYCDPDGQVLSYQYRFETPDGKQFSPVTLWVNTDTGKLFWRFRKAPGQAPLYRLDQLYSRPDAPVVICEGEKAADAAQRLLPGFIAVTSPNGAKAPDKADFSHLRDRAVTIWPDSDAPGKAYAEAVAGILKTLGVAARIAPPIPDAEIGFDAADAEVAGWTQQQARAYIDSATEAVISDRPTKEKRPAGDDIEAPPKAAIGQPRPAWQLEAGHLPEAVDYAERILIRECSGIYQRGYLCRITTQALPTVRGIERPAGAITITTVDPHWLNDQLDRFIQWLRWNKKKEEYVEADAPMTLAHRLIARAGQWRFPVLTGVTTAPTIRPDGSLLQQPGYDAATGLFFDPQGEIFTPIPEQPTQADGRAALDFLIREVLSSQCESDPDQTGFAFTSPTARSAALSAILTPLVRHSLRTAPLHLISATHAGSGKSLLADVVALVATGKPATIFDLGDDEDEQEKRLLSVLLAGDAVINLDNLERPLGGGHINKVLTQETFTGRVLGQSRNATAPTTTTWLATGNNAGVSEDMTRRVVLCELDPQVEAPQNRQFSRDLHAWIPAHRPALVAAGLTAIRAYIVAGKPKQPALMMGSFEDYHHTVRSALIWLGEADPLGDTAKMEDADPTRAKLRALLSAWHGAFGSVPTTAKEAVARANSVLRDENGNEAPHDPILRETLQEHFADDRRGGISARYLGEFLKKFKGRIENGARFDLAGVSHSAKLWRVSITNKTRFEAKKGESGESGESISPQHAKNTIPHFAQPPAYSAAQPPAYSDIDLGQNDSPDSPDSPGAACGQKIDRLKMTPQDPADPAGRPNPESPLAPFLQKIARAYPPAAPVPVDQPAATAAAADPVAARIVELEAQGWSPWNAKAKAEGEAREARKGRRPGEI